MSWLGYRWCVAFVLMRAWLRMPVCLYVLVAAGAVCASCTNEVTFAVTSGPALVWGTGNGDPSNHDPNHASSRVAYVTCMLLSLCVCPAQEGKCGVGILRGPVPVPCM